MQRVNGKGEPDEKGEFVRYADAVELIDKHANLCRVASRLTLRVGTLEANLVGVQVVAKDIELLIARLQTALGVDNTGARNYPAEHVETTSEGRDEGRNRR